MKSKYVLNLNHKRAGVICRYIFKQFKKKEISNLIYKERKDKAIITFERL